MRVSAEARFITRCTREPEALLPRELAQAAAVVGDWHAVADLAAQHGVAGFVRQAVAREGIGVPPFVNEALRDVAVTQVAHVARLEATLARVLSAQAASGIDTVVLKGPVLVRTVYPEAALRPYSDVDLMIRDVDEERTVANLLGVGLEEVPHGAEVLRQAHAGHVHEGGPFHRVFMDASRGVMVELHLDPLQMGLRPTHEQDRWARASRARPADRLMLGLPDQIVQLSVHVHKHGFNRLIWLKDLDLLVRAYGDRPRLAGRAGDGARRGRDRLDLVQPVAGGRPVRDADAAGRAGGVRADRPGAAAVPTGLAAGGGRGPAWTHASAGGPVPGGGLLAGDAAEPGADGSAPHASRGRSSARC